MASTPAGYCNYWKDIEAAYVEINPGAAQPALERMPKKELIGQLVGMRCFVVEYAVFRKTTKRMIVGQTSLYSHEPAKGLLGALCRLL